MWPLESNFQGALGPIQRPLRSPFLPKDQSNCAPSLPPSVECRYVAVAQTWRSGLEMEGGRAKNPLLIQQNHPSPSPKIWVLSPHPPMICPMSDRNSSVERHGESPIQFQTRHVCFGLYKTTVPVWRFSPNGAPPSASPVHDVRRVLRAFRWAKQLQSFGFCSRRSRMSIALSGSAKNCLKKGFH